MNAKASRHFAFITDEVPRPGEAGHLAMNHAIVHYLATRGHRVTVLLARPRLPWPVQSYAAYLDPQRVRVEGPGIVALHGRVLAPKAAPRILARKALATLPATLRERLRTRARAGEYGAVDAILGQFITDDAVDWCAARIAALQPDAVLVDTIFRAAVLRDARVRAIPNVIVAHDVFHQRHAALTARGYKLYPPSMTVEDETALLSLGQSIAAIQPEETALLARLLPQHPVFTAPMPATPVPRPAGVARDPRRVVFMGSASLHNTDGLRWLLGEIWPRIHAQMPDAQLDVCGTVADTAGAAPPGVNLLGRVPDLAPVLHHAALAVAPLRAGSGLKIKLLDFVAHGLGVVTTHIGAEGFADSADSPFLIADEAAGFADLVVQTLGKPDNLEERALRYTELYGPNRVFAGLVAAIERPEALAANQDRSTFSSD